MNTNRISFFNKTFWDLWLQKIFRNFASVKYQWLVLLYIPVIWGMFNLIPGVTPIERWINPTLGLGFLGGGFVTLALGRIVVKSRLRETDGLLDLDKGLDKDLNTDQ